MSSSREVSYFRIGTFVILGITLLIIAILILGSGLLFKKVVYIETYFNDSVQGLSEGSAVKYRGLQIGHVKAINFVDQVYKNNNAIHSHNQYIYVEMAITHPFFTGATKEEIQKSINKAVAQGLRVKLALQGLTGNAYLEIDYLNPKTNSAPQISWKPQLFYIPSATSTLTRFSDNVQYLLDQLKQVKIAKLFDHMQKLIDSSNNMVNRVDSILAESNQQITSTINNMQSTSENLRTLSEHAKTFPSSVIFGNPPPKLNPGQL